MTLSLALTWLLPWGGTLLLWVPVRWRWLAWLMSAAATLLAVAHLVELATLAGWAQRQLNGLQPARLDGGWLRLTTDGAVLLVGSSLTATLALLPLVTSPQGSTATRRRSLARGFVLQGMMAVLVVCQSSPVWLWLWFLASILGGALALGTSHAHQPSDPSHDDPGHPLAAFLLHRVADAALLLGSVGLVMATQGPLDSPSSWFDAAAIATRATPLELWQPLASGPWAGTPPRWAATIAGVLWVVGAWIRIGGIPFAPWCAPSRRLHRLSLLYSYEVIGLLGLLVWQLQPLLLLAPEVRVGLLVMAVVGPAATTLWVMWPRLQEDSVQQVWRRADEASLAVLAGLMWVGTAAADLSLLALGMLASWAMGAALPLATDGVVDDPSVSQPLHPWSPRGLEKRHPRAHTTRFLATIATVVITAIIIGPAIPRVGGQLPWAMYGTIAISLIMIGFLFGRGLRPFAVPVADISLPPAIKPGITAAGGMGLAIAGMMLPLLSLPAELIAAPDSSYVGPLATWLTIPQQQLEGVLQLWPSVERLPWSDLACSGAVFGLLVMGVLLGRYLKVRLRSRRELPLSVAVDAVRDGTQSLSRLLAQQLVPMVWNLAFGAIPTLAAGLLGWLNRVWHSGSVQWATAVAFGWAAWWLST